MKLLQTSSSTFLHLHHFFTFNFQFHDVLRMVRLGLYTKTTEEEIIRTEDVIVILCCINNI